MGIYGDLGYERDARARNRESGTHVQKPTNKRLADTDNIKAHIRSHTTIDTIDTVIQHTSRNTEWTEDQQTKSKLERASCRKRV